MSKPIWNRRTVISSTRNVAVVLWPPSQDDQGHTYPPSITLSEGKNTGTSESPNWQNKDIRLTLDKLPKILADLQLAYMKAVALEDGEVSTSQPTPPQENPKLAGKIYNAVIHERSIALGDLPDRFDTSADDINAAIEELVDKGLVKISFKGLNPFLEVGT